MSEDLRQAIEESEEQAERLGLKSDELDDHEQFCLYLLTRSFQFDGYFRGCVLVLMEAMVKEIERGRRGEVGKGVLALLDFISRE